MSATNPGTPSLLIPMHPKGYTDENVVARLKLPKTSRKALESFSDGEYQLLFTNMNQSTLAGRSDSAMIRLLMADNASYAEEQNRTQRAHRCLVGPADASTYPNSYNNPRSRR